MMLQYNSYDVVYGSVCNVETWSHIESVCLNPDRSKRIAYEHMMNKIEGTISLQNGLDEKCVIVCVYVCDDA